MCLCTFDIIHILDFLDRSKHICINICITVKTKRLSVKQVTEIPWQADIMCLFRITGWISIIVILIQELSNAQSTKGYPDDRCSDLLQEYNFHIKQIKRDALVMKQQLETEIQNLQGRLDQEIADIKSLLWVELLKDKSRYTFHYDLKTWTEADAACRILNSSLVKLETTEEWIFMQRLIETNCSSWRGFWTSAIDLGRDTWVWRGTDDVVNVGLWNAGQPSGDGDCGHLRQDRHYQLNDESCDNSGCYICEK